MKRILLTAVLLLVLLGSLAPGAVAQGGNREEVIAWLKGAGYTVYSADYDYNGDVAYVIMKLTGTTWPQVEAQVTDAFYALATYYPAPPTKSLAAVLAYNTRYSYVFTVPADKYSTRSEWVYALWDAENQRYLTSTETKDFTTKAFVKKNPSSGGGNKTPCSITPSGAFGEVWNGFSDVRSTLNCPTQNPVTIWSAEQTFQYGYMIWRSDINMVLVMYGTGTWKEVPDNWKQGDPEKDSNIHPPQGLYQPVRGFGRVWRDYEGANPDSVPIIGWATAEERGFNCVYQTYQGGRMILTDRNVVYVLYNNGQWRGYPATQSGSHVAERRFQGQVGAAETTDQPYASIKGQVVDRDGRGMRDITVRIYSDRALATTVTDANGFYRFDALSPSPYGLAIVDYRCQAAEGVKVDRFQVVTVNFVEVK
jgi:hypothetical protein